MITKRYVLKSANLRQDAIIKLIKYLYSEYDKHDRSKFEFAYLEIKMRLKDQSYVDLSAKDQAAFIEASETLIDENMADIVSLEVSYHSDDLSIKLEAGSVLSLNPLTLSISTVDRQQLVGLADKCKRLLGWKQSKNYLVQNELMIMAITVVAMYAFLLRLAYKIFPSSHPLPGAAQVLIYAIIIIFSITVGTVTSSFFKKRYPKVVFMNNTIKSGALIEEDWKTVILTSIVIPIIFLLVAAAV